MEHCGFVEIFVLEIKAELKNTYESSMLPSGLRFAIILIRLPRVGIEESVF